jgi:DNA polymerase-3 subunit delta
LNAEFKKLIASLKSGKPAPVYLIDGEEPYYLDVLTAWVEQNILQPTERDFNLTVMYGKDSEWADVVNACRRFPMFAERQVVILKDAAQMKGLAELAGYLENPSLTTVFLIEHRAKKVDGRSKLLKLAKDKGFYYTSEKIKDEALPLWIQSYGSEHGFNIGQREAETLATNLGNDLQKIANEIEKVRINVPDEPELSMQLIQKYIGISREYNIFEFPEVLISENKEKLYKMLAYFLANPKAAPMPLMMTVCYNQFERMLASQYMKGKSEQEIMDALGLKNAWMAKNYKKPSPYTQQQVEACMLLLADYSAKAVGVDTGVKDSELLKELVGKLELILG